MIVYGYAKDYQYQGDGSLIIQVRIPQIHGAYNQTSYMGKKIRNYVEDKDLPWYPSLILPHNPSNGEVVALASTDGSNQNWLVIGLTGGSFFGGFVIQE